MSSQIQIYQPETTLVSGGAAPETSGGLFEITTLQKRDFYAEPLVQILRRFEIISFLFASIQIPTSLPLSFVFYLIDWTNYLAFWYAAYVFIASFMVFVLIEVTLFVYYFTRKELYE